MIPTHQKHHHHHQSTTTTTTVAAAAAAKTTTTSTNSRSPSSFSSRCCYNRCCPSSSSSSSSWLLLLLLTVSLLFGTSSGFLVPLSRRTSAVFAPSLLRTAGTTTISATSSSQYHKRLITGIAMSSSTSSTSTTSLKPYIETLIAGERSLTAQEAEQACTAILRGGADDCQVAALLCLLRARGESADEVAGMVSAMNGACNAVDLDGRKLLDIVGTGGDGADTINISTASVVLAAACGCIVAKAGNRSVSSRCGSADVLESLGVKVDLSPAQVKQCVEQCRIAFMYAPVNHPAMRFVAPVRKSLGVRTVFNILGPMTNAAAAQRAVVGVFEESLVQLVAAALQRIGRVDHVCVVHGCGLDEISPLGPSKIVEIKNVAPADAAAKKQYEVNEYDFDPLERVGIPRCTVEDLKGGGPEENAAKFRSVLQGGSHTNACRDSVVLNAGFGCYVYGLTNTIEEGCQLARTTLESGKAYDLLQQWIDASQAIAEQEQQEEKGAVVSTEAAP